MFNSLKKLPLLITFFCVSLYGEGTINGIITNSATKLPVSHALIQVLKDKVVIGTAKSDDLGKYSFSSIPPESYSIVVNEAHYRSSTKRNVVVTDNTATQINFALVSLGIIKGKVIDETTGNPIEGATVELKLKNVIASSTSQSDGTYSINNVNPAGYNISAKADKYQPNSGFKASVKSNQITTMDFAMKRSDS